jgi:8-oxo-dGTP pyrophosphatase MutT (NUDIX family)
VAVLERETDSLGANFPVAALTAEMVKAVDWIAGRVATAPAGGKWRQIDIIEATQRAARQLLANGDLRLAASIVLVREGPLGPEVFMTKRPGGAVFPDLHVFPGGKVDDADDAPDVVHGADPHDADRQLGVARALRYWIAAIRECFEECGVLLAYRGGELLRWSDEGEVARFDDYRHRLIDGAMTMTDLCRVENLRLAIDRVAYFSHWITPKQAPKRFDTRFFIAAMPADQQTIAHPEEVVDDVWIRPVDALAAYRDGAWQMISPTLSTLQAASRYADTASLLAAVAACTHLEPLTDELRLQGMHELR